MGNDRDCDGSAAVACRREDSGGYTRGKWKSAVCEDAEEAVEDTLRWVRFSVRSHSMGVGIRECKQVFRHTERVLLAAE